MSSTGKTLLVVWAWHVVLASPLVSGLTAASELICTQCDKPALYEKHPHLQETLLATRQRHAAWLAAQPAVARASRVGTVACHTATACRASRSAGAAHGRDGRGGQAGQRCSTVGTARRCARGKTRQSARRPAWCRAYPMRSLRTPQAVKLTVGVGGGEHLEAWLNGRAIASVTTRLIFGRYGCSEGYEGTRVDQVLLDLDLKPGENTLVLRLTAGGEPSFYFSPAPNLVPALLEASPPRFPRP